MADDLGKGNGVAVLLLTGATGSIGSRLLPLLLEQGEEVRCLVRDAHDRFFSIDIVAEAAGRGCGYTHFNLQIGFRFGARLFL